MFYWIEFILKVFTQFDLFRYFNAGQAIKIILIKLNSPRVLNYLIDGINQCNHFLIKYQIQSFTNHQACISTLMILSDTFESQLCVENGSAHTDTKQTSPISLMDSLGLFIDERSYPLVMPWDSGVTCGSMELL